MLPKWSIWVILTMVAIVVLVFGWWLYPQVMGLNYQVRGGRLLEEAIQVAPDIQTDDILCAVEPTSDKNARALAHETIDLLDKAISYDPNLAQGYLMLGRANCIVGELESAIEYYDTFTQLKKNNPLGHLEAGFASANVCVQDLGGFRQSNLSKDPYYCKKMIDEWQIAGVQPDTFINEGKQAFMENRFEDAYSLFKFGKLYMEELPPSVLFQWRIASILSSNEMPSGINSSIVPESLLEDRIQIDGINLQWLFEASDIGLEYGDNLGKFPGGDPSIGIMWWEGGAGTVIHVQCEATYQLTLRASHLSTIGKTGQLQLESDLSPLRQFIIQDGYWQEFESPVHLTKGPHFIGLRYLQDVGDVSIDWIRIIRIEPCKP